MKNLEKDPIENIEKTIKKINDETGQKTRSVLKRYPITFSLLVTFSVVSIFHGFELIVGKIDFITQNPWILILIGLILLISTGTTYKILEDK